MNRGLPTEEIRGKERKPSESDSSLSFLGSSVINNPSAKQKMRVQSIGLEESTLEERWPFQAQGKSKGLKEAWRSSWGHRRVGDDLAYSSGSSSRTQVLQ